VLSNLSNASYRAHYCIDNSTAEALKQLIVRNRDARVTHAVTVEYVLTTARNWAGSIGDFHLTIDKVSSNAVVSLCRQGLRKTRPTSFEWAAHDYVPASDLQVLFTASDQSVFGNN